MTRWAGVLTVAGVLFAATATTASARPEGVSAGVKQTPVGGCGDWVSAVAGIGRWITSVNGCGVFGHPGYRMGFSWATQPGTNTRICVEGQGYTTGSNGQTVRKWYSLGCGTSGGGTVPVGNRIVNPTVRAKTQLGFLGGLYRWKH